MAKLTKEMKELRHRHRFLEGEEKAYKKKSLETKERGQHYTKMSVFWNKQYKEAGKEKVQTKKKIDALSKQKR